MDEGVRGSNHKEGKYVKIASSDIQFPLYGINSTACSIQSEMVFSVWKPTLLF